MQLTDGLLVYLALLLVGLTEISLMKSRVDIEKKTGFVESTAKNMATKTCTEQIGHKHRNY
jgi:hypothetical protein